MRKETLKRAQFSKGVSTYQHQSCTDCVVYDSYDCEMISNANPSSTDDDDDDVPHHCPEHS